MHKILVANRGEIALRIMRTIRDMGLSSVAVYSEPDRLMPFVRFADEAVLLGGAASRDSYLNGEALIRCALELGADAIHPGYGFLSENADFAAAVRAAGLIFIGPSEQAIRVMGDKLSAKQAAAAFQVPLVPGSEEALKDLASARDLASAIGYPILLKAAGGGGGKGMRVVESPEDLASQWALARSEAGSAFGNDAVFLEKYLQAPRHIEIQVLGDQQGHLVHLFERECSVQRRHQKLVEEAGSPALDAAARDALGATATAALRQLGYRNAGTLEFLWQDGQFAFIEMNTRLQVEHPVTEMVCGIDLVKEQIRVAAGAELGYGQKEVRFSGHAIECRVTAEDPETFVPSAGRVTAFHAPGGLGVRVDSALYAGASVPPWYDSMVAKLIVHAPTREEAIARLRRALAEFAVVGIKTTLPLHERIAAHPDFAAGDYTIHWLERLVAAG